MPLAVLSVDLEAKLANFQADLGRASRSLDKLANDAKNSFGTVGSVFAGSFLASAAIESVRGLTALFPSLINGVAAFQDLSEMSGASAASLADFQTAADVSGVSVQDLTGMMNRLTGNLSKLTDEGKGAGAGLKALGLEVGAFRNLTPDQQIKTLAETFDKFADGSGKTAVALALFGKQGAQILKFFKEYVAEGGAVVRLTDEQIAQADNYADAHARMASNFRQTAQVIAVQALPAITALGEGFREGALKLLGFKGATAELKADAAILDFAEGAAVAIATVGEALVGVIKLARAVGGSFQAVAADIALPFKVAAAAASLDGKSFTERARAVIDAIQDRNKTVAEANQRYTDLWTYDGTAVTTAIRKSFAAQRTALNADTQELARMRERVAGATGAKPGLSLTLPDAASAKADEQFAKFMAQITERKVLAQAELDTNEKLSESDRFRITTLAKLDDFENKLDGPRKARVKAALAEAVAVLKLNEAQSERSKLLAADTRATAQQLGSLDESNRRLAEQVDEIGLATDAVEALRIKRLEHKLAIQQESLATLALFASQGDDLSQRRLVIDELQREIDLRKQAAATAAQIAADPTKGAQSALDDYLKKVQQSGTATRDVVGQSIGLLEDDLTTSLKNGSFSVSRTIDFMISEFLRLQVVRPLLKSLFEGGNLAGAGSFLASLFGFAKVGTFGTGGVQPFAAGGVFNSPHLFRFAQGGALATGVLGEAGPEAVMPLARGPGGKLGVRAQGMGGGGGVTIVQHMTFGGGVNRNEMAAWAEVTKQQTLAAVAQGQRRNFARSS